MSTQVNPATNTQALLRISAEFGFSDGAISVADSLSKGYTPVGNIVGVTPALDTTKVEHFSATRGVVRKDRSDITKSAVEFKVKADEFNKNNLKTMFGATDTTGFVQSTITAVAGDTFGFAATNSVIGNWYDLKIAGVRVRQVTAVTIPSLTEGTHFEVDLLLGRIRFLAVQTADRVPTITASAVLVNTDNSFWGIKPLQNTRRTGYGRLTFFDSSSGNNVPIDYVDFSCQVTLDSASELNPDNFADLTISVLITETVGIVLGRYANQN